MKKLIDFADAHLRIFDRPALPPPEEIEDVYLVGICGTGMGSLAGLFQQAGYRVRGADAAVYPPMSTRLAEQGIPVQEGFDAANLSPTPDLVVIGNACTPTHVEATYARENHLVQQSLPEALAHFFIRDRRSLVVAGTHGKTTTTSMLVHVLQSAGLDPGFLVGGVMINGVVSFNTGSGRHFVVEGDEYDCAYFDKQPKFMHYRPKSAIVTSLEFDHADIYENWDEYREAFEAFSTLIPEEGLLALNGDAPEVRALASTARSRVRYYGLTSENLDVTATDVRHEQGGQRFTLIVDRQPVLPLFLPMSGRHNLLNALAVCTVALDEGVAPQELIAGFADFKGIKRRQEIRGEADEVLVVDDFAHHPTAVHETLRAARACWPGRRVVAVFEPRSNSSRRKVFEQGYIEAFDEADLVFLSVPPFRHNDRKEDFLDIDAVVANVQQRGVEALVFQKADDLLPHLLAHLVPGDVALIMSNGSFGGIHDKLLASLKARSS